ncbi:MAG TPA: hypothetical protein VIL69_18895, partial [Roseomonas sp.]
MVQEIAAEREELRTGRTEIRARGDALRTRQNDLLSGSAITVALICAAGLDGDPVWCAGFAKALGVRWTRTSDKNRRTALVRTVTRGLVSPDTARNAARAIDVILARDGDDLALMSAAEQEAVIVSAFARGVHHILNNGPARVTGAGQAAPASPALVGAGLELLQSGQPRRAVVRAREDGTVELLYLEAPDMLVTLRRGSGWYSRAWNEIKNVKGARQTGRGEEERIEARAVPDLLRLVAHDAI